MKAKIGGREYTDPAVVLHVLGVWLNTVEIGLETKPIDKIEAECIDYINAIATAGKLPAATGGYDGYGYDRGSSLGLGYPHGDSPRSQAFQRLFDHMRDTQDRLLRESYPAICETLLSWMADDLETFVYQLSGNAPYSLFPVLRDMPVDKFVKQLDKLQNDAQTNVYETLNSRIYSGRSDLELKHEKPWVKTLIKHLQSRADGLSGVEKWQAQSHLDHYLKSNKGRD